jgi:hypothetical protein
MEAIDKSLVLGLEQIVLNRVWVVEVSEKRIGPNGAQARQDERRAGQEPDNGHRASSPVVERYRIGLPPVTAMVAPET